MRLNTGFEINFPGSIDNRQYLSKQEMLSINDKILPEYFLTLCRDDGRIYIYNSKNETNQETGKFKEYVFSLKNDIKANVSIGGIEENEIIKAGTSYEDLFNKMLIKYYTPSVQIGLPREGPFACGEVINNFVVNVLIKKRTENLKKAELYLNGILVDEKETTINSMYSLSFELNQPLTETTIIEIRAYDINDRYTKEQKTVMFIDNAIYFGLVSESTEIPGDNDTNSCTKLVKDTKEIDGVYSFSDSQYAEYGKILYAYPSSLGELSHIKINNIDYWPSSFNTGITYIHGSEYRYYIMKDAVGGFGDSNNYEFY